MNLRAQLRRVFHENDVTQMPVSTVWRLLLQAEVFTETEIDELCREAEVRVVARVLRANPGLRRRVEEEGGASLEDLRRAIEEDLDAREEDSEAP